MKKRVSIVVVLAVFLAASGYAQDFWELVQTGTAQDIQDAISKGADVKTQDPYYGATPLIAAITYDQKPDVISILLKAGSDVNVRNNEGKTALMSAALYNQHPEAITMLLAAGADAKVRDNAGKTAFDYAQDNWKLKGTDALKQLEEASK